MDNVLSRLVATSISNNISKAFEKTIINANKSTSDQSSTISSLKRALQVLNKKGERLEKYIKNLEEIVGKVVETRDISSILKKSNVTAAQQPTKPSANTQKILKALEKELGGVKVAKEELKEAEDILARIKAAGIKVPALLKQAEAEVNKFTAKYDRVKKALAKLATVQKPAILNFDKNPLMHDAMDYIKDNVTNYIKNNKIKKNAPEYDLKKNTHLLNILKSKSGGTTIKFARFVPLYNIPTVDGQRIDLFLVFMVNMFSPQQRKGILVSESFSSLELAVSDDIVQPTEITESKIFKSAGDVRNILEWIAERKNLMIFGVEINDIDKRRQKQAGVKKLKLLNDEAFGVTSKGPFIIVNVPRDKYRKLTSGGQLEQSLFLNIYTDVKRIAGLAERDSDRLKCEKTTKNKDGSVDVVFRVRQSSSKDLIDPSKPEEAKPEKPKQEVPTGKGEVVDDENWADIIRSFNEQYQNDPEGFSVDVDDISEEEESE